MHVTRTEVGPFTDQTEKPARSGGASTAGVNMQVFTDAGS
jgi:hypothetical protein